MARMIALAAMLIGALLWAILSVTPPSARPASAPPALFSAMRAFADVAVISRAPHPVGSAENAWVRGYLSQRLRALGASVSEQALPLPPESLARLASWTGRKQTGLVAHNLIGVIRGRDGDKPALLVMAHYDSVWGSPGAADDAMGIAVALEVARAIRAKGRPHPDMILLFTDSEELGLDGSRAFFERHRLAARTGMVINLEARGGGGRANMFETGAGNGAQMRLYARAVDRPATNSLAVLVYDLMPNSTDYTIAKRRGIAGFNLATLGRAYAYHSPDATARTVDPASLQDMGDQTLALASAMAFAAELPKRTTSAAFADVLGRLTIVYPTTAGWTILLAAAGLIGVALWRTRPAARSIGRGTIVTVALLLHGALLLTAMNALSGSGGANYYDRLAALPRLETMAGLLIAALLTLLPLIRRPDLRPLAIAPAMALMWVGLLAGGPLIVLVVQALLAMIAACFLPKSPLPAREREPGPLLLLFLVAAILQLWQPTAGPLLQWPLLLAAIAFAGRAFLPPSPALIITAICAAAGVGHLLAQAHFIFLAIGAELPAVMIILLFAVLPLLLPLLPDRVPRWMPGLALTGAMVLALWVRLDPVAPSTPVYSLKTRD